MAVKHEPRLLTLEKGSRLSKLSAQGKFSVSATWSTNRRLGAEQDQRTCGFTGTSLLATVKRRKLARFGDIRRQDSLSKIILQRTLEGGQRHGRQRKCWMDNKKEWTSLPMLELLTRASCRTDWNWKRNSAESALCSPPPRVCVLQSPTLTPDNPIGQGTDLN